MATTKELFVKLKANTSDFEQGMDKASSKSDSSTKSIRAQVMSLAAEYKKTGMTQKDAMAKAWDEVGRKSSESTGKIKGNLLSLNDVAKSVIKTMAGFMIYDVGKKLVSGFADATKAGINYNATLETSAVKWETLLGTQEKANKMLKDIEKFAATTPFEKMGVEAMATQLHNAGFEGQAVFDQLTKFGDMAGAFGIQADSLQEMVRQYSQVQQAGVAYTEDLNILQDRGIPIFKALAEELNINTADVKKWASEGKISAEVYQKALDNIASGVEGGMAKQSQTFTGMVSTLKDNLSQLAGVAAKPIFDFLKAGLEGALGSLEDVTAAVSEGGLLGAIQQFAPKLMPFIQSVIDIFNTLKDSVKVIMDSISAFWQEHGDLIMAIVGVAWTVISIVIMNTITAIGQIVQSGLAIVDGIINFFQNLFQGNFGACWESIKQIFFNAITFVWNWMQVQFAVNLPNMIKNFGTNFKLWIDDAWNAVKNFFKNGGTNVWNSAKTAFMNVVNSVKDKMQQVPKDVKQFMDDAVDKIKSIDLWQVGKDLVQGLINGISSMAGNVIGTIGDVVKGGIDAAKKKLGINSPSRVFMQFGKWTGEGLAIGINGENDNVVKASKGLANSVIGGYNANLKSVKGSVSQSLSNGNNSNKYFVIQSVLDGKIIAEHIAPFADIVNGQRVNLSERGLAL